MPNHMAWKRGPCGSVLTLQCRESSEFQQQKKGEVSEISSACWLLFLQGTSPPGGHEPLSTLLCSTKYTSMKRRTWEEVMPADQGSGSPSQATSQLLFLLVSVKSHQVLLRSCSVREFPQLQNRARVCRATCRSLKH